MHIHLAPDSIEDFLARFAKLSLYKDTIAIDTREMIDNQDIRCHRKSDFDNTLDEVKWQYGKIM